MKDEGVPRSNSCRYNGVCVELDLCKSVLNHHLVGSHIRSMAFVQIVSRSSCVCVEIELDFFLFFDRLPSATKKKP